MNKIKPIRLTDSYGHTCDNCGKEFQNHYWTFKHSEITGCTRKCAEAQFKFEQMEDADQGFEDVGRNGWRIDGPGTD